MNDDLDAKINYLKQLGMEQEITIPVVATAMYLQEGGGPKISTYWGSPDSAIIEKSRDEYFLSVTTAIWIARLLMKVPHHNEWRLSFTDAYLFQMKSLAHCCHSIDLLVRARCYADALSIVRTFHSRVNLLLLFSFAPKLFYRWLENPKAEPFLDGHVRQELSNHSINTFPHFYDHFSELIHGQYQALSEAGFFEMGLYPEVPHISNMVYVAAKLLIGAMAWCGFCAMKVDYELSGSSESIHDLVLATKLLEWLKTNSWPPGRLEHLWTIIAEERHWVKSGKRKMIVSQGFDYDEFLRQLTLFHRAARPKNLGRKYMQLIEIEKHA